jgi:hypothetical protein
MKNHEVLIAFLVFIVVINFQVIGQKNVNLLAGAGTPELIHLGVRYQFDQVQVGGTIGFFGSLNYAYSGEFLFHFGGLQDLSTRKKMYVRLGGSYLKQEDEYEILKSFNFYTRVGREIMLDEHLGAGIDGGLSLHGFEEKTELKPKTGFNLNLDLGILNFIRPALGVYLFYRI